MSRAYGKWATYLRLLCAIALLSISFAHRAPATAFVAISSDVSAFALPDGTAPDLCLAGVHDGEEGYGASGTCEACRLSALLLLPSPTDTVGVPVGSIREHGFSERPNTDRRPVRTANASPRAPPASVMG